MENSAKPDLKTGVPVASLEDGGMILGQADGEDVLLVRRGDELFAVGAACTHYQGPLADGLVVGETVRCPWHHACFSLRTGEALRAPALDPIACWRVERIGDKAYVREKLAAASPKPPLPRSSPRSPASVVILGGGAAGLAAAEMLRREGYGGRLTMISADDSAPYDRPNLSKDFLAGTASDDWIPLRSPDFYQERRIELVLGSPVVSAGCSTAAGPVQNGKTYGFEALLIATGAQPVRLQIDGTTNSQIHYLRTFADSRAIIARAATAKRVAVIGASFIALEVAASLRARGLAVDVVAPESQPLERVMGTEVGRFLRQLHEAHGVVFHLGETVKSVAGRTLSLTGGTAFEADFLVLGVGVRPSLQLAEQAGLTIDRGIAVNQYLETSAPGSSPPVMSLAGPTRIPGNKSASSTGSSPSARVRSRPETSWAIASPLMRCPSFGASTTMSSINYVGHAENWDAIEIAGDLDARDCAVTYKQSDRTLAVATISRDLQSLQTEAEMEAALGRLTREN